MCVFFCGYKFLVKGGNASLTFPKEMLAFFLRNVTQFRPYFWHNL